MEACAGIIKLIFMEMRSEIDEKNQNDILLLIKLLISLVDDGSNYNNNIYAV